MTQRLFQFRKFRAERDISPATGYRMLADGRLKAVKQGRFTYVTAEEAARYDAALPEYQPGNSPRQSPKAA